MGVRYTVLYKDKFDQQCRVDILHGNFSGEPTQLRGVMDQACIITHDSGDDPAEVLVNSKASISVFQQEGAYVDVLELQLAQDREFEVNFFINGLLKWAGFLVADGIQQEYQAMPFTLNLEAVDGLSLLQDIPYTHTDLDGGRCVINYLRDILFSNLNLRKPLPIEWVVNLTNDEFPLEADVFSGSVRWAPFGEGFTEFSGVFKSCGYVLEGLLRSMQCRIGQSDGMWKIWRKPDVATGVFQTRSIPTGLGALVVNTSAPTSHLKMIGGPSSPAYRPVDEKAILRVLAGLRSVKTTYKQDQRDNVLPNGSMDLVDANTNTPLFWVLEGGPGAGFTSVPSLYQDMGKAAQVTGPPTTGYTLFAMESPLPIDAAVLYSYINLGFKIAPISGFTVDGSGVINWASAPIAISVEYIDNNTYQWQLNEFGFWIRQNPKEFIAFTIPSLKEGDVAQLDFNKFQNIILPMPSVLPIGRTNTPTLKVSIQVKANIVVSFDDVYINVQQNSDVYQATNTPSNNTKSQDYELEISSAHSGFYISSFMTEYGEAGKQKFFSDAKTLGVTLTEMNSLVTMRHRYLPSLIYSGSIRGETREYSELYNIYNLSPRIFLPLRAVWNTETNITEIDLVEIRDDVVLLDIDHFGTDDNNSVLSN